MLRMRSVRVSVGGFVVLRDVSIDIKPGRTTVLIGRNGAGKTTTLRTIMGLLPIEGGHLTLDDVDLSTVATHERAHLGIGYAPEDRRLIPDFSVEENLLLPMLALNLPAGVRRKRLASVYELLPEVAALRLRSGGQLSGGQGKMVALARALMVATRAVLLDEPFQGLAPALALSYAATLARVREQHKDLAMLVTESSPKLLDKVVDVSLRIERGHIEPISLKDMAHAGE
jgi:ABC-type branched-subunit amino acid transport system ATPase component